MPGTREGNLSLPFTNNLSKEEFASLSKLKNNNDIVIQSADKGGAIVVMDRSAYIREAERQLGDIKYYRKLNEPIYPFNITKINDILKRIYEKGLLGLKQMHYLRADPDTCRARIFYLLPKIHKDRNTWPYPNCPAGRPIVSDCSSESYHVSEYIDSFIAPLSVVHPAYLKDTYDFISKVQGRTTESNCFLVTGDVSSLYTNMNLDRILQVVEEAFRIHPDEKRPSAEILELLEVTLKNNDFIFNEQSYCQVFGTAMGKIYAPSLANLYLQYFDHMAMNGFKIKPEYYARFLDDIFIIWHGSIEELKEYNTFLSTLIPDIEITLKYNSEKVDFLDTTVYKVTNTNTNSCVLNTRVYFKDTDTHQLLHTASFHPKHTTAGILKSQLLRFKRISSTFEDYANACFILFEALKDRGYSRSKFRKMKRDIWSTPYQPKQKNSTEANKDKFIPLVLRYNQFGNKFMTLWKNVIADNPNFADFRLVAAYSKNKNLGNYLVHSKLKPANAATNITVPRILQNNHSFTVCRSARCLTCKFHAFDSNFFKSTAYSRTFSIRQDLSCDSPNIIYLITCRKCHIQYVGETGRTFRERLTDHRSNVKNNKLTAIGIHFTGPDHSILDIQAIAIEKVTDNPFCKISRKQREEFWQNKLGTKFPSGLNCMPIE